MVVSFAFFVLARVLGAIEFYILGSTFSALLFLSIIHSRTSRIDIEIERDIHPPKVHVGTLSRVELRVRNNSRRRTPILRIHDGISGTRGAVVLLSPVAPGGTSRVTYRLPTEHRGILRIGPLRVTATGPLALTETSREIPRQSQLTVFPKIDVIEPVGLTVGSDPMAGAIHPNALGHGGEDFYALRRYVIGDDMRRVHWPSTARHDELMVRQEELPWQGRTTVLIDLRRATTSSDSLELIISAAASIVTANSTRQDLIRLVGTDGSDSGFAAGHAHVAMILEHLAQASASTDPGIHNVIDRLTRTSTGGALVVIVAEIGQQDLDYLTFMQARFGSLTLVRFMPSGEAVPCSTDPDSTITVTDDRPFAASWNSVMASGRQTARRPAYPEVPR